MANIYELSEEAAALRDALFFAEDDESLLRQLDAVEGSIERKMNYAISCMAIAELELAEKESRVKAANEHVASMRRDRDSKEVAINRSKAYIKLCMETLNIKRFEGDWMTFRIQNNPAKVKYTDNFDINKVPESAVVIVPEHKEIDDKEILRILKLNEKYEAEEQPNLIIDIPGAVLEVSNRLQRV